MSSQAVQANLILIRRLADGTVEWIPIQNPPQHVPVAPDSAYTVVDRADYEAPQALVPQRQGDDLVIEVQGNDGSGARWFLYHRARVVLSDDEHRRRRWAFFRLAAHRGLAGAGGFRAG